MYTADISTVTVGLPVYLEVTFCVAEGFIDTGSDTEYTTWFETVRAMQATFDRKPVPMFQGQKTASMWPMEGAEAARMLGYSHNIPGVELLSI